MSIYQVGQKVKVIDIDPRCSAKSEVLLGREGTIIEVGSFGFECWTYRVQLDIGVGRFNAEQLSPVLPPKSIPDEILAWKNCPDRDCKIARVGELCNG